MFNLIIKAVMWLITSIADLLLAPIMAIIGALVPDLVVSLDGIFNFLEFMSTKIVWVLKFFMIPNLAFTFMYTIFTITLGLSAVRVYKFAIKVYHTFKP